jgi:TRAP-type uncharacterized transport system substrate-binding protein
VSKPIEAKHTRRAVALRLAQASVLLLVVLIALRFVASSAPSHLLFFAGMEDSTEYEYGQRYAELLTSHGVRTTVVPTAGSSENLQRLTVEDQPAVGFATSGVRHSIAAEKEPDALVALASLYVEPAWLFVREGHTGDWLREDRDGRLVIGTAGGVGPLAKLFLQSSGARDAVVAVTIEGGGPGAVDQALERADLNAVFALGGIDSELIHGLFSAGAFSPISFERAAAFTRRHPFLIEVKVPTGSFDLARNLPSQDLDLVAPTVQLVGQADIHPAIVNLLLEAAQEIHREPTFFSKRGEYPNLSHVSLPLDESAVRFFEEGPPRLRKILPYWASTLVDRFATFAAALFGALVSLFSILPRVLGIPMQIKVTKGFAEMVSIEEKSVVGDDIHALIDRLDALDRSTADLHPFRFQVSSYLEYRQQIYDTRDRLRLRLEESDRPA